MKNSRRFLEITSGIALLVASSALALIAIRQLPDAPRDQTERLPATCEQRAPIVAESLGIHYTAEDGATEKLNRFDQLMVGCHPTMICWSEQKESPDDLETICGSSEDLSRSLRDGLRITQVWVKF